MKTVIVGRNSLDPETWVEHEVDNICEFLVKEFPEGWPATARIYHEQVALNRDVTPTNDVEIEHLGELEGKFYVIEYPGDPTTLAIIAIVAVAGLAAVTFLFMPPMPTAKNLQQQSPNNALSNRVNTARPGKRIPEIFGTVRSTPDLLTVPYKVFKNNREVEVCYLCVGRGEYDVSDIRDDTTLVSDIEGMSVEVYAPFTSPKSGDAPQLSIGDPILDELASVTRFNAINGQTLQAPNFKMVRGNDNIKFKYPNIIEAKDTDIINWTEFYDDGESIVITNAQDTNGSLATVDLDGTYTIATVSEKTMTLSSPSAVNPDWDDLEGFTDGDDTEFISPIIDSPTTEWVGPFTVFIPTDGELLVNLVALNGMFKDDGKNQVSTSVEVEFELTPVDEAGTPTGAAETFTGTVVGSTSSRGTRAETVQLQPTFTGYTRVRVKRTTNLDRDFEGTVVDETKIRDLYVVSPLEDEDFGNVTTVFAVTYATDGALAIKERKLNMLATRKLPKRVMETQTNKNTNFNAAPTGTTNMTGNAVTTGKVSVVARGSLPAPVLAALDVADPDGVATSVYKVNNSAGGTTVSVLIGGVTGNLNSHSMAALIKTEGANATMGLSSSGAITTITPDGLFSRRTRTMLSNNVAGQLRIQALAGATVYFILNELVEGDLLDEPIVVAGAAASAETDEWTGDYTTSLHATNNAADILVAMAIDPYIGNRTMAELDIVGIYAAVDDVKDYFGNVEASEFCYTFDDDRLSFEESAGSLAAAIYSFAFRQGSLISLFFEKATEDSVLLFNHRNKLPGTEQRTVKFGRTNDYDGIEYNYVDPADDAIVTYYIPEDRSAVNPKKIESVGVRNFPQAYYHAWRAYNKIVYQNVFVEFTATQEADLLVVYNRILNADNTRADTQDGQIESQDGLTLELSQPVEFEEGVNYFIFLQHVDATIEVIAVTPGSDEYHVVLAEPPKAALSLDVENYAVATYQIVKEGSPDFSAFLLTEKDPRDNYTVGISAVNYDARYYQNDTDVV